MTIFQHEQTQQVIDVSEVKPNLFNVLGTPMEKSILNSCGWWECHIDPGYRGIPKVNADDLHNPSVDGLHNPSAGNLHNPSADFNPTTPHES